LHIQHLSIPVLSFFTDPCLPPTPSLSSLVEPDPLLTLHCYGNMQLVAYSLRFKKGAPKSSISNNVHVTDHHNFLTLNKRH